jgi:hypothetical protein
VKRIKVIYQYFKIKKMTKPIFSTVPYPIKPFFLLLVLVSVVMGRGFSQKANSAQSNYFTVEDYYRVKWGFADEFIDLWKANHYPLLKKALEKGDIISITTARPRLHGGEDTRWDFRVSIIFKNAALAFDENLTTPYKKQLYPDEAAFDKAEQHRFELLLSHWDIETVTDDLK